VVNGEQRALANAGAFLYYLIQNQLFMPTIDIPDKICKHCGGIRWFVFNQDGYTKFYCNLKKLETHKRFIKNNPEKHSIYRRKSGREKSVKLTNTYLKERIVYKTNLSFNDIPQKLIDIKRKQLQLTRQIRELCLQ
jgi:hypothetical protein